MTRDEYKLAADFWKRKKYSVMPREELKSAVEEYLCSSGVCALATGTGDYVRCTPLEFSYHDDKFWIFTEGGEKFIGLAQNNNVSLTVFEKNTDFGSLKSVQVTGIAKIIEPMSEEYTAHAEYKGVPTDALQKLADQGQPMHLLCIEPVRMDVLFSEFKAQGYDSRQVLNFIQE